MNRPSLDPELIAELAEEFLDRRQRGERPTVADYAEQYPELAEQIRAFFPALLLVEDLKPGPGDVTGSFGGYPGTAHGIGLDRLGDFRIIREVGRGGMGVVYEAEQESLGRRVALKVLVSPVLLDPQKLARFQREAKAAARLHHTNIVPVFGVGECGGVHYYVMQYIAGAGLDEVLEDVKRLHRRLEDDGASSLPADKDRDLSVIAARSLLVASPPASARASERESPPVRSEAQDPAPETKTAASGSGEQSVLSAATETGWCYARSVARLGVQIADALEHAHEQGVLHRDIKPSNILLDAHGTAWVTDFGLAKATEDDDLTHTGDIVGTVRYMAPERFLGRCDVRSDVYGLGLTLYELLARQPAFTAGDRNALFHRVSQQAAPRLRKLDKAIPRDLETIVHKAIEKDPAHRYATAESLAEDLRRFLEDRPLRSRRVSIGERLVRWGRRNPSVAVLTATVFVLLVTIATVSTYQALRIQEQASLARDEAYRSWQSASAEARARQDGEAIQVVLRRTLYAAHMNLIQAAWESSHIGRVRSLLAQEDPPPGTSDLRGWEWFHWNRITNGALRTQRGPIGRVKALSYHPDGRLLAATIMADGALRLWDGASGAEGPLLISQGAPIHKKLTYSPDGERIAITGGAREERSFVEVHATTTGEKLWSSEGFPDQFRSVAFSPDNHLLAASGLGHSVCVWNAENGTKILTIEREGPPIFAVAFSADGTRLALGSEGALSIHDASNGATIHEIEGPTGPVTALAFSPDGKSLATAGNDRTVRLWNVAKGTLWQTNTGNLGPVHALRFSPDGAMLASAGADQTVRVIDPTDGHEIAAHYGHTDQVDCIAFSPDGKRLASGSFDHTVKIWEPRDRREGLTIKAEGGAPFVEFVAFSPDAARIAAIVGGPGNVNRVEVWNAASGKAIATLLGHKEKINGLAFRPDGASIVTASDDRTLRFWNVATGRETHRYDLKERLRGMAASGDGTRIVLAGSTRSGSSPLRILDAATGKETVTILEQPAEPAGVAFSRDGRLVASANRDTTVRIWDAASGTPLFTCEGHASPVHSVAFSSDGRLIASGGVDTSIKLWDAATGKAVRTLEGHSHPISGLAFSPDDQRLASAATGTVKLWDVAGGGEVFNLRNQRCVAFSPDGWNLVTGDAAKIIRVWEATPDSRDPFVQDPT